MPAVPRTVLRISIEHITTDQSRFANAIKDLVAITALRYQGHRRNCKAEKKNQRHAGKDFHSIFHKTGLVLTDVVAVFSHELPFEIKLPTRAGSTGGRTDSMPQPKITFAAAPHTRP